MLEIRGSGKELTTNAIVNHARFLQQEKVREEQRQTGKCNVRQMCQKDRIKIVHDDFRRVLVPPVVEPDSVDLILTAAPNKRKDLSLYSDLGKFAATVLKPGKLQAVYAGNYHLAEAMRRLTRHLDYTWTISAAQAHGTQVIDRRIKT